MEKKELSTEQIEKIRKTLGGILSTSSYSAQFNAKRLYEVTKLNDLSLIKYYSKEVEGTTLDLVTLIDIYRILEETTTFTAPDVIKEEV